MPLTDSQKQVMRKKAAKNALEVEHLLRIAVIGDSTDAAFLKSLKAEFKWPDTESVNGEQVNCFGRWVNVICCFLEDSYAGLVRMAKRSEVQELCLGVLEEVKTSEAVSALLEIGAGVIERPAKNLRLAALLASSFNIILSFDGAPTICKQDSDRIREFLHRLLAEPLSDAEKATTVCSLRGVGNQESIRRISELPPFGGAWSGTEQIASRQIKKRLTSSRGT